MSIFSCERPFNFSERATELGLVATASQTTAAQLFSVHCISRRTKNHRQQIVAPISLIIATSRGNHKSITICYQLFVTIDTTKLGTRFQIKFTTLVTNAPVS